jgi:hypothetical protein
MTRWGHEWKPLLVEMCSDLIQNASFGQKKKEMETGIKQCSLVEKTLVV